MCFEILMMICIILDGWIVLIGCQVMTANL
jgi:hypothetical protein